MEFAHCGTNINLFLKTVERNGFLRFEYAPIKINYSYLKDISFYFTAFDGDTSYNLSVAGYFQKYTPDAPGDAPVDTSAPASVDRSSTRIDPRHDVISHDGGIPIFRTRSAEETEAAHDLLSLSQSLPPLPAPGAVTIHQQVPVGEAPLPSPSPTYSYRPLSPEPPNVITTTNTSTYHRSASPMVSVTVPFHHHNYQPTPIVYVVQVPTAPTPPTSECSSDAENQQQVYPSDGGQKAPQLHGFNVAGEVLVLPMSPEPEGVVQHTPSTHTVIVNPVVQRHDQQKQTAVREHSVIMTNDLAIPDRRMKKQAVKKTKDGNEFEGENCEDGSYPVTKLGKTVMIINNNSNVK